MKIQNVNVNRLGPYGTLIVRIRPKGVRRFKVRIWLGKTLIKLGAMVLHGLVNVKDISNE